MNWKGRKTERILDWSDGAFEDAQTIHTHEVMKLEPCRSEDCDEYEPVPVIVEGPYFSPVFERWSGVGCSPAPFRMKAYMSGCGRVFRPAKRNGGEWSQYRKGVGVN